MGWRRHASRSRTSHAIVILGAVIANRNPFIYLNNMGKVMTSGGFIAWAARVAAAAAAMFPIGSEAHAQASPWVANERGSVRLVSAVSGTGRDRALELGLEFRLKPGWKTYWRVPGESGMPPRLDWDGSTNVAGATVTWPGPARFTIAGMQSYGYEGHVILPIRIGLAEPGKAASLRLQLRYAICREVCVPEEARLALDLPAGPAGAGAHARAIAHFAARAPQPGENLGWKVEQAGLAVVKSGADRRLELVVEIVSRNGPFRAPELVAEGNERQTFGLSAAQLGKDRRRVRFVLPYRHAGERPLGDKADEAGEISLTLLDGARRGTFVVRVGGPHH